MLPGYLVTYPAILNVAPFVEVPAAIFPSLPTTSKPRKESNSNT